MTGCLPRRLAQILLLWGVTADACLAYSVLSHEAIIDSVWDSHLRPLLLRKFPNATAEELHDAHAHIYGGCLAPDMGYAGISGRLFTDLIHYVRTGHFVESLLSQSETLNDYAFSLGVLAHYTADTSAHPYINRIVSLTYPKVRRKFGDSATYEDNPTAHLRTEFGIDVLQVARGHYAPDAYHDFIGFKVDKEILQRAFRETYGIEMKQVFFSEDLAIGTYRFSIGKVIPEMTRVAWDSRRKELEKETPGITRARFLYVLPRRKYEKEWGDKYHKPGIVARILSFLFRVIPKVGPLRALAFQPIPAEGEKLFLASFSETVKRYQAALTALGTGPPRLADLNLDTGKPTRRSEYQMADAAYIGLLEKLASDHFQNIPPQLKANIEAFFQGDKDLPEKAAAKLAELRSAAP